MQYYKDSVLKKEWKYKYWVSKWKEVVSLLTEGSTYPA